MPTTPDPALEAARERVVRLLTDRYADDTLTVEEFEARLDRMHALAEPAALDRMARELERPAPPPAYRTAATLPVPIPADAPPTALGAWALGAQAAWSGRGVAAPNAAPDEGRVLAIMSSTKRRGAWAVPRRVRAVAVMGELVLDLRAAALPPECDVEVFALMGNVRVILPEGADAYVEVTAFMAAAEDHTHARYASYAGTGPRVRVTGVAIMAEVKVVGG